MADSKHTVTRLFPPPQQEVALEGLYLRQNLNDAPSAQCPQVYTNFIASLDGRIAVKQPESAGHAVPSAITNDRDWRLFQELAACADALLVSARYIRQLAREEAQDGLPVSGAPEFADLRLWRTSQGLSAQPVVIVLSASLELPIEGLRTAAAERPVYVATGRDARPDAVEQLEGAGIRVLRVGDGRRVDGRELIDLLVREGLSNIYSIAGPGVLETLIRAQVLDRIYITQVHRLIGGSSYDTLLEGDLLSPPSDFKLLALYYDDRPDGAGGQMFCIYQARPVTGVGAGPGGGM